MTPVCGRFVSSTPVEDLAQYFGVTDTPDELIELESERSEPNFNTAPTTDVLAVFEADGARHLDLFRWGLIPRWAKDRSVGNRMINARAETLATKNAFKPAFKRRRCIVPVDGFYEWTALPGAKKRQPWFVHRVDGEPFAFAGLWETWKPPAAGHDEQPEPSAGQSGSVIHSVTIITGRPNELLVHIHDRMPVMLAASEWDRWLDPTNEDIETLQSLFVPAPAEMMAMHPVSAEVNNARNSGAQLVDAVTIMDPDGAGTGLPVPDFDAGETIPGTRG